MGTFSTFFFSKRYAGKSETTGLRLKVSGLRLLATTLLLDQKKMRRKRKKKTATVVGIHIYIHPPSLIIPNPHPLPASSISSTSDIFGGKAKGFIVWEAPKTRNLKLLQNNDLWLSPCLHSRKTHIHKARRCLKKLEIELPYDPAIPLLGIHTPLANPSSKTSHWATTMPCGHLYWLGDKTPSVSQEGGQLIQMVFE